MIESNGEAHAQGPGAKLAAAREHAGLTISAVADRLHLDVDSVRALEADRLALFGAAVFARGHLRRYAELLGIPASDIDAAYAASPQAPPEPDLRRSATLGVHVRPPAAPLRPGIVGFVAAVLVLAALVWWSMRTPPRSNQFFGKTSVAPPPRAVTVHQRPQGSVSNAAGTEPAATPFATASSAATTPVVAASGAVQISFKFSHDCWTEIYDARGARLLYELAPAGSQGHLSGLAPLRVLLGNPAGVTLELNGRAVRLPGGPSSRPLRFSLDGRGHMIRVQAAPGGPAVSPTTPAPAAAAPPTGSPDPSHKPSEAH